MNTDNLLVTVAIIAVLMSAASTVFTYNQVSEFKQTWLTGFASTGSANLTVESAAIINFTTDVINWGSGRVLSGANATLDTSHNAATNSNFTANSAGFVIQNIGNTNVSLQISTGKTAATFVGGTAPAYQYNVTNVEAGSCLNSTYGSNFDNDPLVLGNLSVFRDVNTTSPGGRTCAAVPYADTLDSIRIDLKLVVPSDSRTGILSDLITATATSCSGVPCA